MKGVFAWTDPQLIFLFKLLQAHCTYLKEKARTLATVSVKKKHKNKALMLMCC